MYTGLDWTKLALECLRRLFQNVWSKYTASDMGTTKLRSKQSRLFDPQHKFKEDLNTREITYPIKLSILLCNN